MLIKPIVLWRSRCRRRRRILSSLILSRLDGVDQAQRAKVFIWRKVGPGRRVTLPSSRASFLFLVNGSPSIVRKCKKTWLAQGSSGRRVTLLPGDNFSPYKRGLSGKEERSIIYCRCLYQRLTNYQLFVITLIFKIIVVLFAIIIAYAHINNFFYLCSKITLIVTFHANFRNSVFTTSLSI